MQETRSRIQIGFFAALLLGVLLLNYFIFAPYVSVLFLAAIFVVVFQPVHRRLHAFLGGRRNTTSALSTLVVVLAILIPISFFGFLLFKDAQEFYNEVASERLESGVIPAGLDKLEMAIQSFVPEGVDVNVSHYFQSMVRNLLQSLGGFFTGIVMLIFELFIMILAMFYFFRDGDKFRAHFIGLSPLSDRYDRTILGRLESAVNAVVRGVLLVAFIQGIITGIGFAIFGIPNPILWAAVAAIAALVPTIGTALVIAPAVAYLFFTSGLGWAVGLALWGGVAVGLVDNILAPILMERGLKIHPFLILLSVLGGVAFFGPVGFLAGPVMLTLLFALFDLYPIVIEGKQQKESALIE